MHKYKNPLFLNNIGADLPIATIDVISNSMENIIVYEYMVYSINISMEITHFMILNHQIQFSSRSLKLPFKILEIVLKPLWKEEKKLS